MIKKSRISPQMNLTNCGVPLKKEGYKEGTITEVFQLSMFIIIKMAFVEMDIKTKGWTTKNECIQLAEQGVLISYLPLTTRP